MTCTPLTRRSRALLAVLTILFVLSGAAALRANEARNAATVKPLLTKDLTGIPNKEAVMLTVEYLPGGASLPHRHDAHVFVYVLEGSLRTGVDGQEPVVLKPGETFYESPSDIHRVSENASKTERTKLLVFFVKDKGKPVSSPVPAKSDP
jgi:quercetin dioxygenase-like cupin family protein